MMILAILSIKSHITRSITDRRFDYRRSSVTNPRQPTNTCRRRSGRHVRIRHDGRGFRGGLRTGIDAQPTGTSETILHSAFLHKSQITNGPDYQRARLPTGLFIACQAIIVLAIIFIKYHISRRIVASRFDYRPSASPTRANRPTLAAAEAAPRIRRDRKAPAPVAVRGPCPAFAAAC